MHPPDVEAIVHGLYCSLVDACMCAGLRLSEPWESFGTVAEPILEAEVSRLCGILPRAAAAPGVELGAMPKRDPHRALADQIEQALSHRSDQRTTAALYLKPAEWEMIVDALYAKARKPAVRAKTSSAQLRALRMVAERGHPAGEPRLRWLHAGTAGRLLRDGLIATRPGTIATRPGIETADRYRLDPSPIVDLTDAGRAALREAEAEARK